MRYIACVLFGALLGSAVTVAASAIGPRVVGSSGYLNDFTVKVAKEKVCRDPWVWIDSGGSSGTIECR